MTCKEQLLLWVQGHSVHDSEQNQCCPDFSCCEPSLQASQEEREHFLVADDEERERILMMFLGRAAELACGGKKVYVSGAGRSEDNDVRH